MRIVHFIYDDIENPWLGGGGAIRTHEIYKRLASRHNILVFTGNFPGATPEINRDGVVYRRIGCGSHYLVSRITYVFGVIKEVRRLTYDLLIEDFSPFSPIFSPFWTGGAPIVAIIQNIWGKQCLKKWHFWGISAFVAEKIGVRLHRNFISVSPSLSQCLAKKIKSPTDLQWIPNAVDSNLFDSKPQEENFLLFLGRLEIYQKGLDTLMQAYAKIAKDNPQVHLKLAGSGRSEEMKRLLTIIRHLGLEDYVHFVGRIVGEEKTALLSSCLFVCMPSRFEGWGIVAIEAAACQKAVLGTQIPGLSDAVKHGETGILVKKDSVEALSQAMTDLIHNRELRMTLGKNGREWAKKFSWEESAAQQEQFYFDVVQRFSNRLM